MKKVAGVTGARRRFRRDFGKDKGNTLSAIKIPAGVFPPEGEKSRKLFTKAEKRGMIEKVGILVSSEGVLVLWINGIKDFWKWRN